MTVAGPAPEDWGSNLRVRGVQVHRCEKPLLSVGEYTMIGGVIVLYGVKGHMFHKGSNVAKKFDAWIKKELRDSQYRGCTVAYKENNVYSIYMKPRENKIDVMPLSGVSESVGLPVGSEPVRPEEHEIQKFQEEHEIQKFGGGYDPMRDDVDGDEAMVLRVPNLPPEPNARHIAEHELTGTCSVQKLVSSLRCVEGSSACAFFTRRRRVA